MKPIEPGCLALYTGGRVVRGKGLGSHVPAHETRIIHRAGGQPECPTCRGAKESWIRTYPPSPTGRSETCECRLIRIDGDPDEVQETDKREVVA